MIHPDHETIFEATSDVSNHDLLRRIIALENTAVRYGEPLAAMVSTGPREPLDPFVWLIIGYAIGAVLCYFTFRD